VNRVKGAIGKPDEYVFQSWVRRSGIACNGAVPCNKSNKLGCTAADPAYCGSWSMPINLPENDPKIYSHTRLINDALSTFGQPQ